jgi:hypothetical protein
LIFWHKSIHTYFQCPFPRTSAFNRILAEHNAKNDSLINSTHLSLSESILSQQILHQQNINNLLASTPTTTKPAEVPTTSTIHSRLAGFAVGYLSVWWWCEFGCLLVSI